MRYKKSPHTFSLKNILQKKSAQRLILFVFTLSLSNSVDSFVHAQVQQLTIQPQQQEPIQASDQDSKTDPLRDYLDKLCSQSTEIIEGVVQSKQSRIEPETFNGNVHDAVYTYITISVNYTFKGNTRENIKTLRVRGGCTRDSCIFSPQMPQFNIGERMVLFLNQPAQETSEMQLSPVVGLRQGQFLIKRNEAGEEIIQSSLTSSTLMTLENGETIGVGKIPDADPHLIKLNQSEEKKVNEMKSELLKINFIAAIQDEIEKQRLNQESASEKIK